jgi:hypothetical protein
MSKRELNTMRLCGVAAVVLGSGKRKLKVAGLGLLVAGTLVGVAAVPAWAGTVTIQSNASNLGAALTTAGEVPDAAQVLLLQSGDTSGLTFSAVSTLNEGTFTSVPAAAPAGTLVVEVPPDCGSECGQSGFIETTFTLPTGFTAASLEGEANVDDIGYVFLNGNLISGAIGEFGDTAFGTSDLSFFQAGTNTVVISDENTGGPSGVAYYADIDYSSAAGVTPEPGSFLLLGSGLLGLAGMVRSKFGLRA